MRIVYDLETQPRSLGDVLMFQQTSLLLTDEVDFCFAHDPKRTRYPGWLIEAGWVNQNVCSVEVKTHDELKSMTGPEWPRRNSAYLYYECMEMLKKAGEFPALKPRREKQEWAREFLSRNGRVTIQVRNNKANPGRNSDVRVWMKFLKSHPDEKFVVVGLPEEIDPRLRLPNVTVVTDCEEVCAVVEASDYHMGVSSGPAQMKLYSKKPFCIFRDASKPGRIPWLSKDDLIRYPWGVEGQSIYRSPETLERVEAEFSSFMEFA